MNSRSLSTLVIMLAIAFAASPLLAMAPVKREASANRDALTELEARPLDLSAIASLADWTHPGTLDADAIKGKVVLLAVVSSDPQSVMSVSKLARMKRDFQDQGLVVAAIHPSAGFDLINQKVTDGKVTIPVARDEGGVFAAAMLADDYPDLYLIDRAGNLRFADFDKKSIKDAIAQLTAETPESAAANAALQAQGLAPEPPAEIKNEKENVNAKAKVRKVIESASWPEQNSGKLYARTDSQGKHLPVALPVDQWESAEDSLEGKVVIVDFWKASSSPCRKAAKVFNELLEAYPNQLQVVGVCINEEEKRFIQENDKGKRNYPQLHTPEMELYDALQVMSTPHTLVMSTDGVIRWQGFALTSSFRERVEQIIAADPGVED